MPNYSIHSYIEEVKTKLEESSKTIDSKVESYWDYEDGEAKKGLEFGNGWYFGPEKDGKPIGEGKIVFKNGTVGTASFDGDNELHSLIRNVSQNETETVIARKSGSEVLKYKSYLPTDYTHKNGEIDENGKLNHFGSIEKNGVTLVGNFKVVNGIEMLDGYGSINFYRDEAIQDGEAIRERGYFKNDVLIIGERELKNGTTIKTLFTGIGNNDPGSFGPNGWNGMIEIENKNGEKETGNYSNGLKHGDFTTIYYNPYESVTINYNMGRPVQNI